MRGLHRGPQLAWAGLPARAPNGITGAVAVVTESSRVSGAVCDLCRGRRRWPIGRLSLPVAFEVEKILSCTCQVEQVLPRGERGGVRCRRRIEKPDSPPPHDAYGSRCSPSVASSRARSTPDTISVCRPLSATSGTASRGAVTARTSARTAVRSRGGAVFSASADSVAPTTVRTAGIASQGACCVRRRKVPRAELRVPEKSLERRGATPFRGSLPTGGTGVSSW
jgi:hypothetical protein